MARDGIADFVYVNPGYQPGRFPIIAAGELPFIVGNAKGGNRAIDAWYRKYAATEMKDVHYCFSFVLDPVAWHSTNKKIVVPADIHGMKVRPAQGTIAAWVTQLGGTNVQSSAPEVRDVLAKGVADAVTFPWGSMLLFGIDKVTKYDMDAAARLGDVPMADEPGDLRGHVAIAEESDRRSLHQANGPAGSPTRGSTSSAADWRKSKPSPSTKSTRSATSNSPSGRSLPSR